MSSDAVTIVALACGAPVLLMLALVLAAFFSPRAKAARGLRRARQVRIAAVEDGAYAKVVGRARAGDETLVAPISKRSAVCYELTLTHRSGGDTHGPYSRTAACEFAVEDESAIALVPAGETSAQLVLRADASADVPMDEAPEWLLEALRAGGMLTEQAGRRVAGHVTIEEAVVEVGEMVAVAGAGHWRAAPAGRHAGLRDAPKVLVFAPHAEHGLRITDDSDMFDDTAQPSSKPDA
jgi:hypothetical protein